jgi:transposase IS200 family protein
MREWHNQSHVRWYCRYHIVIVPKYRQKAIFGTLRKDIGKILRELCHQMGIELVEGHAMPDHVHLCLSIPPKYRPKYSEATIRGNILPIHCFIDMFLLLLQRGLHSFTGPREILFGESIAENDC